MLYTGIYVNCQLGVNVMEHTRYSVLLVEDDKLDQVAFARLVEDQELQYDCKIAGSVSEAKTILDRKVFDVIITDYLLGDGTAFDILDSAKKTPVIVVTGSGNEDLAVKVWKAGAYDYLIKDIERNYLKAVPITIENAIRHRRSEGKLRLLSRAILSTDDNVYITDTDNRITFVNRIFCETYGYDEEDIIGKDCGILCKDSPSSDEEGKNCPTVDGREVGLFHKRKDGSEFPVSLSRSVIKNENGDEVAVVVIAHDISERMRVENELRTEKLLLEKKNRLRDALAVTVCRRLMTLADELESIISDVVSSAQGNISPQVQKELEHADNKIDRFRGIVSEFLDISKLGEGQMQTAASKAAKQRVTCE